MVLVPATAPHGAPDQRASDPERRRDIHWSIVLVGILALCVGTFGLAAGFLSYARPPRSLATYDELPYRNVIGIDIGNTYSRVAIRQNGTVKVVETNEGQPFRASSVTFHKRGSAQPPFSMNVATTNNFGIHMADVTPTHQKPARDPDTSTTIYNYRALLGRSWTDPEVQRQVATLPYKVSGRGSSIHINPHPENWKTETITPEDLAGINIWSLKHAAEQYLNDTVSYAVMTVPASFNDAQRQAIKDAANKANLRVLRIVNEPIATAIAYELDRSNSESNVVVIDLGGSSLHVNLLEVDTGVFELFDSASLPIGGRDINQRIVDHLAGIFHDTTGLNVTTDVKAMARLNMEAEDAKLALSTEKLYQCDIEALYQGHNLSTTLTRAKFEDLNDDLFKQILSTIDQVLTGGKVNKSDVHEVILAGGSSKIPKVIQLVEDHFGGKKALRHLSDEAVITGAAIQAAVLSGDYNDELCCLGCYMDVIPLSLGIEAAGGHMARLVHRNTPLPTRKVLNFTTAVEGQRDVRIRVFSGERPLVKDNFLVGEFVLGGIEPAPAGQPWIEVAVEIDANEILFFKVVDKASGSAANMTVANHVIGKDSGWDHVDGYIQDAEENWEVDAPFFERFKAESDLSGCLFAMRMWLSGAGKERLTEEQQRNLLESIQTVQKWLREDLSEASAADFSMQKEVLMGRLPLSAAEVEKFDYTPVVRLGGVKSENCDRHDEL